MFTLDDINSFDTKITQIASKGLKPFCNHDGYDGALFCCTECSSPLFSKNNLEHMHYMYYCFSQVERTEMIILDFDVTGLYPKTSMSCSECGQKVGYIETSSHCDKKHFYVLDRSVFLEVNGARCYLETH